MKFKSPHMKSQWDKLSWVMRHIVSACEDFARAYCDREFVITRISDPVKGESGVHLDRRGVDVRTKGVFTEDDIHMIVEWANLTFPRNDGFDTCIYHKGTEFHLHFQAPDMINDYN